MADKFELTEWHLEVSKNLGSVLAKVESMESHLAQLNGKVFDSQKRISTLEREVDKHPGACPLVGEVDTIKTALASAKAAHDVDKQWYERFYPVIKWFAIIILFIIVKNIEFAEWINFFK